MSPDFSSKKGNQGECCSVNFSVCKAYVGNRGGRYCFSFAYHILVSNTMVITNTGIHMDSMASYVAMAII